MSILSVNELKKSYKKGSPVLDGLTLEVGEGKIVGLLGPNGCGKSTLMKLVTGLLQPDSGSIFVDGIPVSEATKAIVSYLPERTYFTSGMKVKELVDYFEEFYADFDRERAQKLMEDLKIESGATLKSLSKGTKEKIQLILVMSRRAKLYLLDEPIAGVDPAAREYILKTIVSNYSPGSSIIITTHLITDIEQVLDEFFFLGFGGKILNSGNAAQTREQSGKTIDEMFKEVFRC